MRRGKCEGSSAMREVQKGNTADLRGRWHHGAARAEFSRRSTYRPTLFRDPFCGAAPALVRATLGRVVCSAGVGEGAFVWPGSFVQTPVASAKNRPPSVRSVRFPSLLGRGASKLFHCAFLTLHSAFRILHCSFCTFQFSLCTFHSALSTQHSHRFTRWNVHRTTRAIFVAVPRAGSSPPRDRSQGSWLCGRCACTGSASRCGSGASPRGSPAD